jgi:exonuclease VII large subunit
VLERGYTITRDARGRAVRRVSDAAPGSSLFTEVADGVVVSTVDGDDRR